MNQQLGLKWGNAPSSALSLDINKVWALQFLNNGIIFKKLFYHQSFCKKKKTPPEQNKNTQAAYINGSDGVSMDGVRILFLAESIIIAAAKAAKITPHNGVLKRD